MPLPNDIKVRIRSCSKPKYTLSVSEEKYRTRLEDPNNKKKIVLKKNERTADEEFLHRIDPTTGFSSFESVKYPGYFLDKMYGTGKIDDNRYILFKDNKTPAQRFKINTLNNISTIESCCANAGYVSFNSETYTILCDKGSSANTHFFFEICI